MRAAPFVLLGALAVTAALVAWAQQRERAIERPGYELKSVLPRETSPAQYKQVDERELEALADQGWELAAVVPYIYKNGERGTPDLAPRPMVTQTYPAYFFKRLKLAR
jgi:hypothetical protein